MIKTKEQEYQITKNWFLEMPDFKLLRKGKGLTLREVEEITGISNAYLSQLETGKIKKPSFDTITKLKVLYEIQEEQPRRDLHQISGKVANVITHLTDMVHKISFGAKDQLISLAYLNARDYFKTLSDAMNVEALSSPSVVQDQGEAWDDLREEITKFTSKWMDAETLEPVSVGNFIESLKQQGYTLTKDKG